MSTKCSLAVGEDFHLYKEVLDDETVYLRITSKGVKVDGDQITLDIPLAIWEHIRSVSGGSFEGWDLSNEEIQKRAEAMVHSRIKEVTEFEKIHPGKSIMRIFGMLAMGDIDDPVDQQIETAYNSLVAERDLKKKMKDEYESIKAADTCCRAKAKVQAKTPTSTTKAV